MKDKINPSLSGRQSATGKVENTVVFSAALPVLSSAPPSLFSQAFLQSPLSHGSVPPVVNMQVGRLDQYDHFVQSLTAKLKAATGSRRAEFKSQTQLSVTAFVSWQQFNAQIRMPTGAGKALCVLLPVAMEKAERKPTIIIVPSRAPVTQHLMTDSKFELVASADFGDPGTEIFAHLYVFLAEQVHKLAFRELISRLPTKQLFSIVVIDEVHLTLLWESFRVSLQSIRTGLSVISSHIPRILLSATVPPHQRVTVLKRHDINHARVFSMPTPRKNLGFELFVFQAQS